MGPNDTFCVSILKLINNRDDYVLCFFVFKQCMILIVYIISLSLNKIRFMVFDSPV